MSAAARLPRAFFERPVLDVAPDLLGCVLVRGRVALRLTEVEAYAGHGVDPGSHAFRGRTPRTAVMFGPAGHLYVYFTYGMHHCANVVTGPEGEAGAVLLRAGEIVGGHDLVTQRRPRARPRDVARGPARLTTALALTRDDDGRDLCGPPGEQRAEGEIWLVAPPEPVDASRIRSGPRVGVSGPGGDGAAYPWRFWIDGEPTVSPYRPGRTKSRASLPDEVSGAGATHPTG